MFTDTHSHLNFKDFAGDYSEVIERARENNVKTIINVGSNLSNSKKAVEIAENFDGCYAAVGLHPIHLKNINNEQHRGEEFDEKAFLKLAKHKKVVAIGETGLDYYHDRTNIDKQKEVFHKSINLAIRVNKPIIIHSREAGEDILSELMIQNPLPKGVFHCFSEDLSFAKVVVEMGFYISFTGIITFTKNQETLEVVKETPLDKILIETDCPYLTPRPQRQQAGLLGGRAEPHRGERNEPAFVVEVAKKIAEIKKLPLEKIAEATTSNAKELFNL